LLGGRFEPVDDQQHPKIADVDVEGRKCLGVQPSQESVCVLEQVGQSLACLFADLVACWHS
jgi:hypothetical protein